MVETKQLNEIDFENFEITKRKKKNYYYQEK